MSNSGDTSSSKDSQQPTACALVRYVERLLATNSGQTPDARASAAQRVMDKTILLDNPVKAGGVNTQAGLVR